MQMIEINKLIPHPRNKEFFDDMFGDRWEDFKESIGRRGIVEAVVTTQDLVIVSGHQRVRAAKEIGLLEVPIIVKHYDEDENKEDMILEDLISTNIMQRGVGNVNAIKMSKCIIELEKIKGIQHGGDRFTGNQYVKVDSNNYTQKDLAKQLNMTPQQLRNYKKLNDLIPELQNLVSTGALSSTTGYKIWAKMPQDEQEKFFNDIGRDKIKTLTQKTTKESMEEIKQNNKSRKQISKTIEKHLINRSHGKCEICGWGGLGLEGILEKHHIVNYSKTQDDSLDNLIMICPNCHATLGVIQNQRDESMKQMIKKQIGEDIYNKIIKLIEEGADINVYRN